MHATPTRRPGSLPAALATVACLVFGASGAGAQRFEVTPALGYQVGGELTRTGELGHTERVDFEESGCYSLTLGYYVSPESILELTYSLQPTEPALPAAEPRPDLSVQSLLLGGTYHWRPGGGVDPYIQLSVGASSFEIDEVGSATRFASAFGGGVRLRLSPRLAVRLDGRVLSTYAFDQGELICRPGLCYGWAGGSWMNQLALSAGLILGF